MKNNQVSSAPLAATDHEYIAFEKECAEKISRNLRNIAQFRENSNHIGPVLKARFDKRVNELEQKNAELQLKIQTFYTSRQNQQATFNKMQTADLKQFKTEFNTQMKEII